MFLASNEAADDLSGGGAAERRAAKAAGFVAWGSAAGNEAAYTRGDALFRGGVDAIRADGSPSHTVGAAPTLAAAHSSRRTIPTPSS